MSYTALTYHLVFSTFQRVDSINAEHERELYKYLYDFATQRGAFVRRIGGMPDHIHVLCDIPAKISVADFVKLIKAEMSKFLRDNPHFPKWTKWSEGYGAFTVDASLRAARVKYIMNQKQHHAGVSFENEYREMLAEAGVDINEI